MLRLVNNKLLNLTYYILAYCTLILHVIGFGVYAVI